MSDEDDYMSCAFLNVKDDVRPGLVSKSVKRKFEIEKARIASNKVFRTKSRKELEEESRNAGMNSALDVSNKGFALLQKMGYKPGMKLGRESTSCESGLIEPIKVTVKADRKGLGREEAIRKRIEKYEERKKEIKTYKEQETQLLTEEFRDRMKNQRTMKRLMRDLHKCQKICEQLDIENGIEEPMRTWFWYTQELGDDAEDYDEEEYDEDEEELSVNEKIDFICEYIRPKYYYCFWCCVKYENADDLHQNCPGPDKNDHDDLSS